MTLKEQILELVIGAIVIFTALSVYLMPKFNIDKAAAIAPPIDPYGRFVEASVHGWLPKLNPPVTTGPLRVIAVLDTGFNSGRLKLQGVRLCALQNYDAVTDKPIIGADNHGHGTSMAYLAAFKAQVTNYCILGIRIFDDGANEEESILRAFKHLNKVKGLDVVSMSWSGPSYRFSEVTLLKSLSNKGIKLFVAAGNQKTDLTIQCATYPACYNITNLYAVGALSTEEPRSKAHYSNYGNKVSLWYPGLAFGMNGTSVATALAAGAYAASLNGKE